MSRIGKKPIDIPSNVKIKIEDEYIIVMGPMGEDKCKLHHLSQIQQEGNKLTVTQKESNTLAVSISGTMRALIQNMISGVSKGFEKKLILVGVGYKAQVQGNKLILTIGYSHTINYDVPTGISIESSQPTEIIIKGVNKQLVGQVAATVRRYRAPELYKGKGIRYFDEKIILKETKKK